MKLNKPPKIMYYGREVRAIIPKNVPLSVTIDVMQKEGDCNEGYSEQERMTCLQDCQNTFASFVYSLLNHEIIGVGCLTKNNPNYIVQNFHKHNLNGKDVEQLISDKDKNITIERLPGRTQIKYKNDPLVQILKCGFIVAEKLKVDDQEIKQYFDLIYDDPEKIMKECGVEIIKEGGLEIITYRDQTNRADLPQNYFPDEA